MIPMPAGRERFDRCNPAPRKQHDAVCAAQHTIGFDPLPGGEGAAGGFATAKEADAGRGAEAVFTAWDDLVCPFGRQRLDSSGQVGRYGTLIVRSQGLHALETKQTAPNMRKPAQ